MTLYNTRRRQLNRKPDIIAMNATTDDYGNLALATCRYTGEVFPVEAGLVRGALLPQASAAYLDGPNSAMHYKADAAAFHAMDRNCNTCTHLQRAGGKSVGGVQYGRCLSQPTNHPYPVDGDVIAFAPDDYMGMDCWRAR